MTYKILLKKSGNFIKQQFVRSTIAVNNTLNISNTLSNMVWIINPATAGTANVTLHPGGPTGTYHYINSIGSNGCDLSVYYSNVAASNIIKSLPGSTGAKQNVGAQFITDGTDWYAFGPI